jgi:hypothetical protein
MSRIDINRLHKKVLHMCCTIFVQDSSVEAVAAGMEQLTETVDPGIEQA